MIVTGGIYLADLNLERRIRVLVLSGRRFHEVSGRALVAPAQPFKLSPWHVESGDDVFGIDLLATAPTGVLLERVGVATNEALRRAHVALRNAQI